MNTSDEKYRGLRQLPPFPAIATKLLRVLSHDDAEVREIVDLIRADTALASELLRIVNSPVYGFQSQVSSIQRAILLLGLEKVRQFALTVAVKGFLNMAGLRLDLLRRLWRSSLACGLVCEELAPVCPIAGARGDQAYTAGLLHDIGRLGLFVAHPETYAEVLNAGNSSGLLERERRAFGMDHCEAGAWLAETWGLPEGIRGVITGHHQPPGGEGFALVDLVRVSVLLSEYLGFDLTASPDALSLPGIRALLPPAAQYRFDPDPIVMKARITGRLDTFD